MHLDISHCNAISIKARGRGGERTLYRREHTVVDLAERSLGDAPVAMRYPIPDRAPAAVELRSLDGKLVRPARRGEPGDAAWLRRVAADPTRPDRPFGLEHDLRWSESPDPRAGGAAALSDDLDEIRAALHAFAANSALLDGELWTACREPVLAFVDKSDPFDRSPPGFAVIDDYNPFDYPGHSYELFRAGRHEFAEALLASRGHAPGSRAPVIETTGANTASFPDDEVMLRRAAVAFNGALRRAASQSDIEGDPAAAALRETLRQLHGATRAYDAALEACLRTRSAAPGHEELDHALDEALAAGDPWPFEGRPPTAATKAIDAVRRAQQRLALSAALRDDDPELSSAFR